MLSSSSSSSFSFTSSNIFLYNPHPTPSSSRLHQLKVVASSSYTSTETRRPRSRSSNNPSTQKMAAAASSSSSSLYEVLGISMSASGHEIKAAYRRLARMCHPDVVAMNQKEISATEFMKIHAAYSTLSDPDKRANYDRNLFRRNLQPVDFSSSLSSAAMASMSTFSGTYTGRNWETDQCW